MKDALTELENEHLKLVEQMKSDFEQRLQCSVSDLKVKVAIFLNK